MIDVRNSREYRTEKLAVRAHSWSQGYKIEKEEKFLTIFVHQMELRAWKILQKLRSDQFQSMFDCSQIIHKINITQK